MGGGGGSSVRYDSLDGASLSVIDSKFGPMLVISPPSSTIDASIRTKRIPLKMIKIVQARSGGILNSLVGSNSGIEIKDNFGREVLRFDLLKRSIPDANNNNNNNSENDWQDEEGGEMNMDLENAEEKTRDDIIDHLQILIEWERRRQAYLVTLGDDENDNSADNEVEVDEFDDDTEGGGDQLHKSSPSKKGGGGAIAEQARKIQHFAQREIEMQKLKRERENRKAKYVKEAGGLKYTAIAMANRS